MPKNFIPCDRDQAMLMPPDMRDWLPDDHLVWFVIDSVAALDLSSFYAKHRDDGWGRAAYDPSMMVTLLLYAYAVGVRSAREIERRSADDVAMRVITANRVMDHATLCRFRTRHRAALSELFVSVLGLCADAGLARPTVVAIDGTKIGANASAAKNLTREQLEEFARQVFDEAERVDAAEDQLYGDRRGDELPEHLRDRAARLEWLKQRVAEQDPPEAAPRKRRARNPRVNTTDPDSAVQKTPQGYIQGFNAQLAVTEDQVIVAADLVSDNNDVAQLEPMITQAQKNLAAADAGVIDKVVADAGYFSEANAGLDLGPDLLVAPVATRNLRAAVTKRVTPQHSEPDTRRCLWEALEPLRQRQAERRDALVQAYVDGHVTALELAETLGLSKSRAYSLAWHYRKSGRISWPLFRGRPPGPDARQLMLQRFAAPGALQTYALRGRTIEPVFGQIKDARGMRRLIHRGLAAGTCEWRMMATGHNLLKLWRASLAAYLLPRPAVAAGSA